MAAPGEFVKGEAQGLELLPVEVRGVGQTAEHGPPATTQRAWLLGQAVVVQLHGGGSSWTGSKVLQR